MLLRRITKHVKDQNWFAVGLDFLIVVIGVFIGLQVANWNEARLQKADERQLIQRLADEAAELKSALSDYRTVHSDTVEANFEFVKLLEDADACLEVNDTYKRLSLMATDFPPPRFSVSTIDGLIGSGRSQLIESADLRDRISEMADEFDFIERQWTRYVAVKRAFELSFVTQSGFSVTERGDLSHGNWDFDLDRVDFRTPENLCRNPRIVGAMTNVAITQEIYLNILNQAAFKLEAYSESLDQQIGG
ncbi:MAG: hypothetical protein AAF437_01775 [Pseudomonadota bacterium]